MNWKSTVEQWMPKPLIAPLSRICVKAFIYIKIRGHKPSGLIVTTLALCPMNE